MIRLEHVPRLGTFSGYLDGLAWAHSELSRRPSGDPEGVRQEYLHRTVNVADHLRQWVTEDDLAGIFFTPHHHAIRASLAVDTTLLVNSEWNRFTAELDGRHAGVTRQAQFWDQSGSLLVIPDTNYFLAEHRDLTTLDHRATFGAVTTPNLTIVVLSQVVDELDRLKTTAPGNDANRKRQRARAALKFIEAHAGRPGALTDIQPPTPERVGTVQLAVVLDQPGHTRLPIADDEIVACSLAVQEATGRAIRLISYDQTGFTLRARAAGLPCHPPQIPLAHEPTPA